MDGSEAATNPNTTSATPDAPRAVNILRRVDSRTSAMRTPAAAPANANPIQGNPVNVVLSAAGRMYHCIHVGSVDTNVAVLTSGVTIVHAVARTEYATTRAA